MGAKHSKKNAKKEAAAPAAPVPATTAAAATSPSLASAGVAPAWIDSTEPRKRTLGKIVLVAVWIYVAALWLLALDQTFHWGIFGPKVPPIP
jgi:hypothetical protein